MADDKTSWSEKGKRGGDGESSTPSRPSKRDTSSSSSSESSVVRTPSSDAGARKVAKAAATAGQRDVSFVSRLGFPALIALVCLLGIGVVVYARSTREALAQPVQNLDHWHSVYGVYNCAVDGDNKFLPAFQSVQDDTGIHSHGDGIMHIHPFFELSSGDNAQLRHWFSEMNVEITNDRILVDNQFDPFVDVSSGDQCADGTTGEVRLLRWQFDFQALAEDRPDAEEITDEFGEVQFRNDREVYLFAFVSEDMANDDIPVPPEDRFNTLNNVSSSIEYDPNALAPLDSGTDLDSDE